MSGKLIVFEGTDGSGKATQSKLLFERLQREGVDCRKLNFPRYGEKSAALVELYLGGAFGTHPSDVNAYAASTFYSATRPRTPWIRPASCRTASGSNISTGFSALNTAFWACPSRRSSFISMCRPS